MRSSRLLRDSDLSLRGFLIFRSYPIRLSSEQKSQCITAAKKSVQSSGDQENYLPSPQGLYISNKKI